MRQIGVSYSGFVDESYTLLSLFDDVEQIEKDNRLQTAIDVVKVLTKDSEVSESNFMFLHFMLHQLSSEANEFEDKIKMGT